MGKGKKKKKKKGKSRNAPQGAPSKPREYGVQFTVTEDCVASGISLGVDGTVLVLDQDGKPLPIANAKTVVMYDRGAGKGKKILVDQPTSQTAPKIHPDANLSSYGALFAADTNSIEIGSDKVSVVAFAKLERAGPNDLLISTIDAVEIRNPIGNPERIGWRMLCQSLLNAPDYLPSRNVGIVVDSELGLLPLINSRAEPVEGSFFLPEGIHLVYASADASPDSMPNRMIRACDNAATQVISHIAAGDTATPLEPAPPDELSFSHFRMFRRMEPRKFRIV